MMLAKKVLGAQLVLVLTLGIASGCGRAEAPSVEELTGIHFAHACAPGSATTPTDPVEFVSDRSLKEGFAGVDSEEVLQRLAALPMTTWRYQTEGKDVRHMGPMSQDFHSAFGLGEDESRIQVVDSNGVTMAAIQALYHRVESLQEENVDLRRRTAAIEQRLRPSQVSRPEPQRPIQLGAPRPTREEGRQLTAPVPF